MVPEPIRRLWAYQKHSDLDILEVEAIGPVILLENWVDILQHAFGSTTSIFTVRLPLSSMAAPLSFRPTS